MTLCSVCRTPASHLRTSSHKSKPYVRKQAFCKAHAEAVVRFGKARLVLEKIA